ncbi:MAG: DUF5677 domain-containing protein [Candidatus Paceibacterota bacterium]
MNQLQDEFITLIEDLSTVVSKSFQIDRSDKNQLCTMVIYATIIENSTACAHLMSRATFSSMPILIRANLEALIDLKNSIENDRYYKKLHSTFLKQKKNFLHSKVLRGNEEPGLKSDEFKNIEKEYIQIKEEIKRYIENGFGPLKVKDKFELCNSLEDYETTYAGFCLETHNDLSVLEKKHIVHDKNEIPNVALFKERGELDKEMFLSTSIGILGLATKEMAEFLDLIDDETTSNLLERFDKLQSSIKEIIKA